MHTLPPPYTCSGLREEPCIFVLKADFDITEKYNEHDMSGELRSLAHWYKLKCNVYACH